MSSTPNIDPAAADLAGRQSRRESRASRKICCYRSVWTLKKHKATQKLHLR